MLLRTFNDVQDSWAKKMSEDGLTALNFTDPCHHVVRFVDWAVLIEPVNLHIFVVFVRDALEASLRSLEVLQCDNSRQCFVSVDKLLRTYFVRHGDDTRDSLSY
jgi:hypothetical protein